MDSNFEALFTHFKPTDDQIKALLLDLWRKNEEKQKKIEKLRRENEAASLSNEKLIEKIEKMVFDCNIPYCLVCNQNFDTEDHQPNVLSCPHIICSKCLYPALPPDVASKTATESGTQNNDQNYSSKICPMCHEPVTTTPRKLRLRFWW